ncbi:MAG: DUF1134 domain-containing protein [Hyphomicrobiaceae bacterium]|nr:DUF1134 domain-containing protein [Hyphomicrobiaceae bacterium]
MRLVLSLAIAGTLALGGAWAAPAAYADAATAAQELLAPADATSSPPSVVRLAQQGASQYGGTYGSQAEEDSYRPSDDRYGAGSNGTYRPPSSARVDDAYRPPSSGGYGSGSAYNSGPAPSGGGSGSTYNDAYQGRSAPPSGGYGEPYAPPPADLASRHDLQDGYPTPRGPEARDDRDYPDQKYYSKNEIIDAGHGFFGSISKGLASVIEYAFKKSGRPNGYILGEDASGAFVAGLRYGEGRLYTKDAGTHKVYWQGPSVGYDFGGAGAKTMILVYNLRTPRDVYHRFGGVEGSAYLVGGVSIQFQKYGDVVMAPIRAGVGLRLGANVGYLKYTRKPTWNPF